MDLRHGTCQPSTLHFLGETLHLKSEVSELYLRGFWQILRIFYELLLCDACELANLHPCFCGVFREISRLSMTIFDGIFENKMFFFQEVIILEGIIWAKHILPFSFLGNENEGGGVFSDWRIWYVLE